MDGDYNRRRVNVAVVSDVGDGRLLATLTIEYERVSFLNPRGTCDLPRHQRQSIHQSIHQSREGRALAALFLICQTPPGTR